MSIRGEISFLQTKSRQIIWKSFDALYRKGASSVQEKVPDEDVLQNEAYAIEILTKFEENLREVASYQAFDFVNYQMELLRDAVPGIEGFVQEIIWTYVRSKYASRNNLAAFSEKNHIVSFRDWYHNMFHIAAIKFLDVIMLYDSLTTPSERMSNILKAKRIIDKAIKESLFTSINWDKIFACKMGPIMLEESRPKAITATASDFKSGAYLPYPPHPSSPLSYPSSYPSSSQHQSSSSPPLLDRLPPPAKVGGSHSASSGNKIPPRHDSAYPGILSSSSPSSSSSTSPSQLSPLSQPPQKSYIDDEAARAKIEAKIETKLEQKYETIFNKLKEYCNKMTRENEEHKKEVGDIKRENTRLLKLIEDNQKLIHIQNVNNKKLSKALETATLSGSLMNQGYSHNLGMANMANMANISSIPNMYAPAPSSLSLSSSPSSSPSTSLPTQFLHSPVSTFLNNPSERTSSEAKNIAIPTTLQSKTSDTTPGMASTLTSVPQPLMPSENNLPLPPLSAILNANSKSEPKIKKDKISKDKKKKEKSNINNKVDKNDISNKDIKDVKDKDNKEIKDNKDELDLRKEYNKIKMSQKTEEMIPPIHPINSSSSSNSSNPGSSNNPSSSNNPGSKISSPST